MENLSVTIITKNEEKNIGRCLASLKWADEIVVVDTNSTDRTVEICRQHTEQIFGESWHGYGKQKNICAMHAKNRWILNIDADEVVTSASAEEIQKVLKEGPQYPAYQFPRKNYFLHQTESKHLLLLVVLILQQNLFDLLKFFLLERIQRHCPWCK